LQMGALMFDFDLDDLLDVLRAAPITGQVMDIIDTVQSAYNLYKNPRSEDMQFEMALCLVGWIPGPGDALKLGIKRALRNPDTLFTMVRTIMAKFSAYGDPEDWLNNKLSSSSIGDAVNRARNRVISFIRDTSWLPNRAIPPVEQAFNTVRNNIGSIAGVLLRKIARIKPRQPQTSHNVTYQKKPEPTKRTTPNKPKTKQTTKEPHKKTYPKSTDKAAEKGSKRSNGKTGSPSSSAILKTLSSTQVGVVGEHMGDYWVAKALGLKVRHDTGQTIADKLDGKMTQLSDSARGVGMDSLWRTNGKMLAGHKTALNTFTVYEYKASKTTNHKSTGQLLGSNKGKKSANTTTSGKVSKRGVGDGNKGKDPANQQMSEKWIDDRLKGGEHEGKRGQTMGMTLFFGADAILEHGLALLDAKKTGGEPIESKHLNHKVTRVITHEEAQGTIKKRIERSKQPKKVR